MEPSIKEYFSGKTIFITGGSGFIGKALIEKLLRSCPEIGKIYIMLRPKKGKEMYERVEQILSCPLFVVLKETYPENLKKIVPINGDTTQLEFALSEEDKKILQNEVHVFFHLAASVRFDDFLKDAILTNVRGAREAARLALNMKKIEMFMHLSTTYCNIDNKKYVEEIFYPPHGDWREAITVAENCDTGVLNIFTQKYIGDGVFPNTYTYSKQLTEHCINDMLLGKIPTVICRPSVVFSSIMEPFIGWVDNFNGPVGLLLAGGSGLLRIVYGEPDLQSEYVPVDNLVKLMIVAAWDQAIKRNLTEILIFHASKYMLDDLKQIEFITIGKRIRWEEPFENKIWFPSAQMTSSWLYYFVNVILFHVATAFILDRVFSLAGMPPMLFKTQRKIYIANMALQHFMLNEWYFINTKTMDLLNVIPANEVTDFNFNIMPTNYKTRYEYYRKSCAYGRVHMLKESKEITQINLTKTKIMYYLDIAVKTVFFAVLAWMFFFNYSIPLIFWKALGKYWNDL